MYNLLLRKKNCYFIPVLAVVIFIILFSTCKKDEFITGEDAFLAFSDNKVVFDTIFTTIGSLTKHVKVYNPHEKKIKIKNIYIANGSQSNYRININGYALSSLSDVVIFPGDSMYIFVEVTINPGNINTPFIVSDSIVFEVGNKLQSVELVAWGQDAYYHYPNQKNDKNIWYSSISTSTWINDKPHVVYGYLKVDSNATLTLQEGTRVHFHKNAGLWIAPNASLQVNGTLENPVIFAGDRLEYAYSEYPGQWNGIWFEKGHNTSIFNFAEIKNGTIGLDIEDAINFSSPSITLKNTIIKNMNYDGISANATYVNAENCVISNCGRSLITINKGGKYQFQHCTLANYWNFSIRRTPSLRINNYAYDSDGNMIVNDMERCFFGNCIVYGNNTDEVVVSKKTNSLFNSEFLNCLLKDTLGITSIQQYNNCIFNENPEFSDPIRKQFSLKSNSPAINKGDILIGTNVPLDFFLKNRISDGYPDIGAIEYFP